MKVALIWKTPEVVPPFEAIDLTVAWMKALGPTQAGGLDQHLQPEVSGEEADAGRRGERGRGQTFELA